MYFLISGGACTATKPPPLTNKDQGISPIDLTQTADEQTTTDTPSSNDPGVADVGITDTSTDVPAPKDQGSPNQDVTTPKDQPSAPDVQSRPDIPATVDEGQAPTDPGKPPEELPARPEVVPLINPDFG